MVQRTTPYAHHYSTAYFFPRGGRQEQWFPMEKQRIDEHPTSGPADFKHVLELDTRAEIASRGCSEIGWKGANHLARADDGCRQHRCVWDLYSSYVV